MFISLTAAADDNGRRLDRILRKALPDMPLSAIHRLLRKGGILVNGKAASADYRVHSGQTISLCSLLPTPHFPLSVPHSPTPYSLFPDMILFEGSGLLVLNKPADLPVHGKGSLEDLVRLYLEPKLPPSLSFKPGPLHRLDRPSSGVIAFSTSLKGARFFSEKMRNRMIKKQYLALVNGEIKNAETWEDELVRDERRKKTFRARSGAAMHDGTKSALTRVSPLLGNGACTLIMAEIETGRTHQIRAQAASRGHPLLGDIKYGGDRIEPGAIDLDREFLLHAWRMNFPENTDNNQYEDLPWRIEAPLPEKFLEKIQKIFGKGIITDLLSQL